MSDCREKLLQSFANNLITRGFSAADVKGITNALLLEMRDYSIEPMPTALALNDDRNAALIRAFVATGLTEGKSKNTAKAYKYFLEKFAREIGMQLTDVQTINIRMWIAEQEQRVSLATCENNRAYLSAFYSWMLAEDIINKNPMAKIKPIKVESKIRLPFSSVEIDALRGSCTQTRDRAIFEVLISSGVRVSELCALDLTDIDYSNRKLIVKNGKGGKGRTTYISEVARKYLQDYLSTRADDSPALFLTRLGGRVSKSGIEKLLRELGARAGVSNTHPHRCRRTFATDLGKRGLSVQEVQRLLGHTNINTTMVYMYLDDSTVETAYKKCG